MPNHKNNKLIENQDITVTLTLDDNSEVECVQLAVLKAGGKEYAALLPVTAEGGDEEGDVFLYRYTLSENGLPSLENIEDDEEFKLASEAFDEWLDTQEYYDAADEDEGFNQ